MTAGIVSQRVDVVLGCRVFGAGRLVHVIHGRTTGPEWMVVPRGRVGEESRRLPDCSGVDFRLASVEEVERHGREGAVGQRCVRYDRGQPGGGQRLLHAVGRERVDERRGIADQQHPGAAARWRMVEGGVASPGRGHAGRLGEHASQGGGLGKLGLVARGDGVSPIEIGDPWVDHHRHVATGRGDRDRPRPAVIVGLDQRVRVVAEAPAVPSTPHRRQRERGPADIVHPEPAACDDAGPTGAVEDELRLDGVRARVAGRVADRRRGRPGAAGARRDPRRRARARWPVCVRRPAPRGEAAARRGPAVPPADRWRRQRSARCAWSRRPTRPCCRSSPGNRPCRLRSWRRGGRRASGNWAVATRRATATGRRSWSGGAPSGPRWPADGRRRRRRVPRRR